MSAPVAAAQAKATLLYSASSPHARKVRVIVREKGLHDRITEEEVRPLQSAEHWARVHPLAKLPTLVADGLVLYDSTVIAQYLDSLSARSPMVPAAGADRWLVLRGEALADGLVDCAVSMTLERWRPLEEQSAHWLACWQGQVWRALSALDADLESWPGAFSLAHIAAACALGYLDFRHRQIDWRGRFAPLARWFDRVCERESMRETPLSPSSYASADAPA